MTRRPDKAWEVIRGDKVINDFQMSVDGKTLELLAVGQPLGSDLRLITMTLKINHDLERMGDHAVNIAERAIIVAKEQPLSLAVQIPEMAMATQKMLKDALLSYLNEDVDLARSILKSDDEVDAYQDSLYGQLQALMQKDSSATKVGVNLIMAGHNLERIADLSGNIAEDVIYMKQGKEVRHRMDIHEPSSR